MDRAYWEYWWAFKPYSETIKVKALTREEFDKEYPLTEDVLSLTKRVRKVVQS